MQTILPMPESGQPSRGRARTTGRRPVLTARRRLRPAGESTCGVMSVTTRDRATRVTPDMTEKTGHGGSEADSWIDAGRGVSEVGRQGGEQTPEQAGQAERNPEKAPVV